MKKKAIIIILVSILLILTIAMLILKYKDEKEKQEIRRKIEQDNKIINEIKSYYHEYSLTTKKTKLYKKDNENFVLNGEINKNIPLLVVNDKFTVDTKYFYIPNLDSYIYYKDLSEGTKIEKDDRYKNYIYFNNNIITKDITKFYDKDDNYLYTLNKSFDFKVLVKDIDRYGIVFNDELLYIKSEDVENIYDIDNNQTNKSKIKTLTYHFIYNPEYTTCDQAICYTLDQFEANLKYLKENNGFTLTLDELEMYLDGKINIPEKSIVLTIDDGTIIDTPGVIGLLEKYDMTATIFLITSWVDIEDFKSPNLKLESHSDNMHNQYECAGYGSQGGGILCLPEEKVLEDLKTSQEKLGGSKYFAYPFFDFSDRAISLLKKAGFHMAFIGQYTTDGYSYPNKTNKYKVPRKTIFSTTTMNDFISYLN